MFQPQATLVYPTFFPTTTTSQPFTTTTTPSIVNSVYDYSEPIETSRPQHIQRVNSQQQEEVRFSLGLEQTQAQTAEHQIAPSNDYPRFSNRPHTAGPLTFEQPLFTDSGAPRLFTPAISQQYPTTTASPSDFPSIASYSITQSISPYARPSSTTARSQLPYLSRKRRQNQFELNSTLGGYIRRSPRNFRPRMSASEYGDGEERLDMAREEELAREYDPTAGLTGPNVGVKKSTRLITESYADADLVYVEKTTMLPETYSHFREVIGDGVCGWRGMFSSHLTLPWMARLPYCIANTAQQSPFPTSSPSFTSGHPLSFSLNTTVSPISSTPISQPTTPATL